MVGRSTPRSVKVILGVHYANCFTRDATCPPTGPNNTHPVHGLYTFNILLEHNSYLFRNLAFGVLSCFRLVAWVTHPSRSVDAFICFYEVQL